jgi:hypothetical protein
MESPPLNIYMGGRTYLMLGFTVAAILPILFFSLALYSNMRSQAMAQETFSGYCGQLHGDDSSYKMVYDKAYVGGHYYDYSVTIPGTYPGEMGFLRVYVPWIGGSFVRGFQGRPF